MFRVSDLNEEKKRERVIDFKRCVTSIYVEPSSCLSSPRCSVLANIAGTDLYRDRKDYLHVSLLNDVKQAQLS